jgi:hypothetical protein
MSLSAVLESIANDRYKDATIGAAEENQRSLYY